MKFRLFLASVLFFLSSQVFPSTGIGGGGGYVFSTSPSECVIFSFRQDTQPWSFALNFHPSKNKISVFADDWFISENISGFLDYFVLWGISGEFRKESGLLEISTGCRFGAGLDFMLLQRHLELYFQAVWNPYFGLKKEKSDYDPLVRPLSFPVSAGFRVWA